MNEEFDKWWDGPVIKHSTNPYKADTAVYWSYEAWMRSAEAEREACIQACASIASQYDWLTALRCIEAIKGRGPHE